MCIRDSINGPPDALAGLVHIGEQRRVAQFFLTGKQGQCFGRVGNALAAQQKENALLAGVLTARGITDPTEALTLSLIHI